MLFLCVVISARTISAEENSTDDSSFQVARVVQQLRVRPHYLYLYLDALFDRDPYLASDFADDQVPEWGPRYMNHALTFNNQVALYAEFDTSRLIDFLRASNYYSLEKAYRICRKLDMVPEMVFLLGRMGGDENNKQALNLIIERLGDVNRVRGQSNRACRLVSLTHDFL